MRLSRLPPYVFGLSKKAALDALVFAKADEVRDYADPLCRQILAVSRRFVAKFEATPKGFDTRYVVTNISHGGAQWLYDSLYCARGQAC